MKTKVNWFDRMMLGVTFAEANLPGIGRELMDKSGKKGRRPMVKEQQDPFLSEEEVYGKAVKV